MAMVVSAVEALLTVAQNASTTTTEKRVCKKKSYPQDELDVKRNRVSDLSALAINTIANT